MIRKPTNRDIQSNEAKRSISAWREEIAQVFNDLSNPLVTDS